MKKYVKITQKYIFLKQFSFIFVIIKNLSL